MAGGTRQIYLWERMGFDLGEFVLHIVWIHCFDLFSCRGPEDLDDFDQLIDATLTRKERLPEHELRHDTPGGPYIDVGHIVGGPKDELRGAVVTRANIADVGLAGHEDLCWPKVAKLEDAGCGIEKEVLGLDIAMTDSDGVYISQWP
jgi:hypothetical protein